MPYDSIIYTMRCTRIHQYQVFRLTSTVASVCTYSISRLSIPRSRPTLDTIPDVTVLPNDKGEPSATTNSPGLTDFESANFKGLKPFFKEIISFY